MRFLIIIIFFLLTNCNKPKTVLICGDHVCLNKTEAEQFFEENLSIEVKIIDSSDKRELDLVEINLNKEKLGTRNISISSKASTKKNIKTLSNQEISRIKKNIKNKKKRKISKKETDKKLINRSQTLNKNVNKKLNEAVDICTIIEKCSIEEITKYLLKEGKKKGFPDITIRQ
tara:strand:+ start:219 stop:737 length:519 start_codon:yes stop_codon:yes gene_type:complete